MAVEAETLFRNMEPSDAIKGKVAEQMAWLERHHDRITHLVGQQGQRDHDRQGHASQHAQHHRPDRRRGKEGEPAARARRRRRIRSARRLYLIHDGHATT